MTSAKWIPNTALQPKAGTRAAAVVVWVVTAALALRFCWIVTRYAVNLFFFDEWDIYGGLFQGWPWWRFFLQEHGPHRQGLGVTVVVWLLRANRWDSRVQAYAVAAAIIVAALLAIRVKTKVFGKMRFSDVIIPILFLGLGQWEILLAAPGPSAQAFPLFLLMLYCLAWVQERVWPRYIGICLLNFLLIYTGYGIFVAGITLVLLAIDCWQTRKVGGSLIAPTVAWLASAAALASFFSGYVFSPAADCYQFPYRNLGAYPLFMGLMFAKYLGIKHVSTLAAIIGMAVIAVVVTILARSFWIMLQGDTRARLVVVLTGYTLIYAGAAAIGRVCLGLEAAESSRNATLLIPGFLGIYFYLLKSERRRHRAWLVSLLLLVVAPSSVQRYHKEIEGFSAMKRDWKNCYRSTEDIQYCNQSSHLQLYPRPEATHLHEKLKFLKQNHLNLYANND